MTDSTVYHTWGKLLKPIDKWKTWKAGTPVRVIWRPGWAWYDVQIYGHYWKSFRVPPDEIAEYVISDRKAAQR